MSRKKHKTLTGALHSGAGFPGKDMVLKNSELGRIIDEAVNVWQVKEGTEREMHEFNRRHFEKFFTSLDEIIKKSKLKKQ